MFSVRDVVLLNSPYAISSEYKLKFHICVSNNPICRLVFISSNARLGNFPLAHAACPFLPKKFSYVSHTELLPLSTQTLRELKAAKVGEVPIDVYKKLYDHLQNSKLLSAAAKKIIQVS